jgi:predicted permease
MVAQPPRPPLLGRLVVRLRRLRDRRAEVEADLAEQFRVRLGEHGRRHAARRYLLDVASLWRRPGRPAGRPISLRFDPIWRDLVFALRMLRRRPGLFGLSVTGLALAIGVSTAVFGLVTAAALRPSGLSDPASVVSAQRVDSEGRFHGWSYDDYQAIRGRTSTITLEAMLYEGAGFGDATAAGFEQRVDVHLVSGGYLETFGARPVRGRLLQVADADPAAPLAAVVSEGFWTRRLGGNPSIIGRTVLLSGTPVVVVGIAERTFTGPAVSAPAFWITWNAGRLLYPYALDRANLRLSGRLRPDQGPLAAEAELSALVAALEVERSGEAGRARVRFGPPGTVRGEVRAIGWSVLCAVALVLLLAAANLANLLLANAAERQREIGVRRALGADRRRLVRQLLTEGLVLACLGSVAGLALALWLSPTAADWLGLPPGVDVTFDLRVYAFLAASTLAVGGLAALAPVRHGLRGDLTSPLKGGASTVSPVGGRLRATLIAVQATASLLLLVSTAVLSKSAIASSIVDLGLDVDRLIAVSPRFPYQACEDACIDAYLDRAVNRVRALPEVQAVATTSNPPMTGSFYPVVVERDGVQQVFARLRASETFFEASGVRIVQGRSYTDTEGVQDAPVAVVTEAFARRLWTSGQALGQSLDDLGEEFEGVRVVGVATDAVSSLVPNIRSIGVFTPMIGGHPAPTILVRTPSAVDHLPQIHAAVAGLDSNVRVSTIAMRQAVDDELRPVRSIVAASTVVTGVALALALIGLYGVTAFVLRQRTQEIGIRMALGARGRDVAKLLGRQSLQPVVVGLIAGLLLAVLVGRLFMTLILGVSPTDPMALGAAASVLLLSAAAAIVSPARRASRVDPASVLRQL